ncbi:putative nwd2 protein [Mycena venus]|uniref:Putative nwd2 protein n=1 Tax=Mycena venus TaxID=2733690 RepID=A0A8H7CSZ5_9AGAR|nr:putative nwd2 protein [Mycena venus]
MPRQDIKSQEINNIYVSQLSGGTGGAGGSGGQEGGGGGPGEGPNFRASTIHLVIQNHLPDTRPQFPVEASGSEEASREFSGAARHMRRHMRARHTPYGAPSLPSTSLPFTASDPHLRVPHPDNYSHPMNRTCFSDLAIRPSQSYNSDWSMDDSFPVFESRPLHEPLRSIHGGTFIAAETVNHRQGDIGIDILHRAVALEALYDSADSFPQPKCHPETRTQMLEGLYNWATQANSARPGICWLHGPAGAGKSAIMQTLCQRLQDEGRLGGAFFFKRGHATRGNAKVLFATLAYQLALNNPNLKALISQGMEKDPSIVGRAMDVQLQRLIVEPCRFLSDSVPPELLIDGLDECDPLQAQAKIIHLINSAVCQHPKAFRFIIASRSEAHIREIFDNTSFNGILHSVNVEQSFEDIRRYFQDEFARIHHEHQHTMADVPIPWPSWNVLEGLVQKSSGYFIYASTVIKFIDDQFSRPTERLEPAALLFPGPGPHVTSSPEWGTPPSRLLMPRYTTTTILTAVDGVHASFPLPLPALRYASDF